MKRIKQLLVIILLIVFCGGILALALRGFPGNPIAQTINNPKWVDEGPLELSPDRSRFALTFSIVEDKSFSFSLPVAKFATPDLGYVNGKYVSLFAPGLSFLIIPGYILGKIFGSAQVGAVAVIALFALLNGLLLRAIGIKLGANPIAATIASLVFIFATPAFTYAVSLYQHHISIFLILLSIYILLKWNNLLSLGLIWFLAAASITVDYPNFFLMAPVGLLALGRIFVVRPEEQGLKIDVKLLGILTFATVALPLAFFLWFNKISYGNPFQLSGTVSSVKAIDERGLPTIPEQFKVGDTEKFTNPELQQKTATRFFKTRNLLNGFYTHFASLDRGIIGYTPIVLFGILGIPILYQRNQKIFALLLSIVGVNFLLYSMWGDPYGGWAFGSRYLIPSYAIMSILISQVLTKWKKNSLFLFLFILIAGYSIAVNTLGAVTSSRNPPKVEAIPLSELSGVEEKYTPERNLDFLKSNRSKSFIFQTFAFKYLTAWQYYLILTSIIAAVISGLLIYHRLERQNVRV